MAESTNGEPASASRRRCFVVSAFGSNPDEQRRYKQVLRHLIQKVLEPHYEVVRADQIDDEGLITNQIIEHLLEDDLVVADLTGLNPNVFYEVAVRHAARKPIVHLITKGEQIPFDVANMRAVPYALDDPDVLEDAQAELKRKVAAIEESGWKAAPNPISAARDVWLLRESGSPEVREAGELLGAFHALRDEVRSLGRRIDSDASTDVSAVMRDFEALIVQTVKSHDPIGEDDLAARLGAPRSLVRRALRDLEEKKELFPIGGGKWSELPF
jgi:hypothetical protein